LNTDILAIDRLIGKRLAVRRAMTQTSQAAVAAACGCSFQQISKYENGRSPLTAGTVAHIGRLIKVMPQMFYPQEGEVVRIDMMTKADVVFLHHFRKIGRAQQAYLTELAKAMAEGRGPEHVRDMQMRLGDF
jgi:transcriptional regulator with XRE-family HTH domain